MKKTSKEKALKHFFKALKKLQDIGILTNKKDFTGQLGEWLVETLYKGKRAVNCNQKGWDVDVNGKHIQVKTHAKAKTNPANWSSVIINTSEKVDELIIIVFTHEYKLKHFYQIPWGIAISKIKFRTKQRKPEINWKSINDYDKIDELLRQDIINIFR